MNAGDSTFNREKNQKLKFPPSASAALTALTALRQGETLPSTLLEECIARIERHNPAINALVTLDLASARASAARCDRYLAAHGFPAEQPLFGLPISVKDAFATAGLRTTSSHPPLRDHVPTADATVVARLRAAGAILVGKSNLSQLAGDPQCWSPLFGPTRNPWAPERTPGGSSGGSAAAIAMGFSLLEAGSDIAGSIRIPAAYCGVAGLKATENRIPRTGHIPHLPGQPRSVRHLLSFGLLARSVADLELGFPILAGPDGIDHEVAPLPVAASPLPERPLRLAWWDQFGNLPLCQRTRSGLAAAIGRLQAAGHHVERAWPADFPIDDVWRSFGTVAGAEIGLGMSMLERHFLRFGSRLLPAQLTLSRAFTAGVGAGLATYNAALDRRERLIGALENFLADFDALLCPVATTVAYPAFPPARFRPPPNIDVDGQAVSYIEASIGLTAPFSLTGSPVVSLPAGVVDGLPVGLQIVGRRWQETRLLALARRIEALLPASATSPLLERSPSDVPQ